MAFTYKNKPPIGDPLEWPTAEESDFTMDNPMSYEEPGGDYGGGYGSSYGGGYGISESPQSKYPTWWGSSGKPYETYQTEPIVSGNAWKKGTIYDPSMNAPMRGGAGPSGGPPTMGKPFFVPSGKTAISGNYPGGTFKVPGATSEPLMTPPVAPSLPQFKMPIWDTGRVESIAQREAGPGLRELRKGLREAQGRYYENPNVRRMTLRDALAGYGLGLEKVMGGARKQALSEYEAEYQPKVQEAVTQFTAEQNRVMAQYQNAWRDYLARMQSVKSFGG